MIQLTTYNFEFGVHNVDINLDKKFIQKIKKIKLPKHKFNKNNFNEKTDVDLMNFLDLNLKPYFKEVAKKLNKEEYNLINCWVQKYEKTNFHDCHTHILTDYSFILYIECSEKSSPTIFYNPLYPYVDLSRLQIKPSSGKLLVFSGCIPHMVPPNEDNKRLIVSGNIAFQ